MFTRRTATVTISAPDASTARRVSSRERYSRPASTNGSAAISAAPDEVDHLDTVALAERRRAVGRPRDDRRVHLDRDAPPAQTERLHEIGDGGAGGDGAGLVVDDDLHRPSTIAPRHRPGNGSGERAAQRRIEAEHGLPRLGDEPVLDDPRHR